MDAIPTTIESFNSLPSPNRAIALTLADSVRDGDGNQFCSVWDSIPMEDSPAAVNDAAHDLSMLDNMEYEKFKQKEQKLSNQQLDIRTSNSTIEPSISVTSSRDIEDGSSSATLSTPTTPTISLQNTPNINSMHNYTKSYNGCSNVTTPSIPSSPSSVSTIVNNDRGRSKTSPVSNMKNRASSGEPLPRSRAIPVPGFPSGYDSDEGKDNPQRWRRTKKKGEIAAISELSKLGSETSVKEYITSTQWKPDDNDAVGETKLSHMSTTSHDQPAQQHPHTECYSEKHNTVLHAQRMGTPISKEEQSLNDDITSPKSSFSSSRIAATEVTELPEADVFEKVETESRSNASWTTEDLMDGSSRPQPSTSHKKKQRNKAVINVSNSNVIGVPHTAAINYNPSSLVEATSHSESDNRASDLQHERTLVSYGDNTKGDTSGHDNDEVNLEAIGRGRVDGGPRGGLGSSKADANTDINHIISCTSNYLNDGIMGRNGLLPVRSSSSSSQLSGTTKIDVSDEGDTKKKLSPIRESEESLNLGLAITTASNSNTINSRSQGLHAIDSARFIQHMPGYSSRPLVPSLGPNSSTQMTRPPQITEEWRQAWLDGTSAKKTETSKNKNKKKGKKSTKSGSSKKKNIKRNSIDEENDQNAKQPSQEDENGNDAATMSSNDDISLTNTTSIASFLNLENNSILEPSNLTIRIPTTSTASTPPQAHSTSALSIASTSIHTSDDVKPTALAAQTVAKSIDQSDYLYEKFPVSTSSQTSSSHKSSIMPVTPPSAIPGSKLVVANSVLDCDRRLSANSHPHPKALEESRDFPRMSRVFCSDRSSDNIAQRNISSGRDSTEANHFPNGHKKRGFKNSKNIEKSDATSIEGSKLADICSTGSTKPAFDSTNTSSNYKKSRYPSNPPNASYSHQPRPSNFLASGQRTANSGVPNHKGDNAPQKSSTLSNDSSNDKPTWSAVVKKNPSQMFNMKPSPGQVNNVAPLSTTGTESALSYSATLTPVPASRSPEQNSTTNSVLTNNSVLPGQKEDNGRASISLCRSPDLRTVSSENVMVDELENSNAGLEPSPRSFLGQEAITVFLSTIRVSQGVSQKSPEQMKWLNERWKAATRMQSGLNGGESWVTLKCI